MNTEHLPLYIDHLLDPLVYAHPVQDVELVQTHISYVLLAGNYVYKFKKPVDFGFLDFSTLEKRELNCRRELELNRRLCPDIYKGLVTVNEHGKALVLNGVGPVVEYGIKMIRMPQDRMMSAVIERGELAEEHIRQLVDVLVPFYQRAEHGHEIEKFGRSDQVAISVLENFDQTEEFIGQGGLSQEAFETISASARHFLDNGALFDRRIEQGRIRNCHGDLYSANICLDEPLHIYDCIEFNERFRFTDVASDVAFLAMDLDFHGLTDLASLFIDLFVRQSGDEGLLDVLPFYKCYRAYVRGKIGLFTAADPAVDEKTRERALGGCARYFALAKSYAVKEH
ncbi:MAG: hypothetical protein CSA34_05360 [Desulfobulbus propionicus]|nr:MAG: hypothetical protein CSA34_05360 [Desulfobulbus propionicus]